MKNVMKAQEKEIEIVVTYKCNWNCSYCCVDTHNQPEPTTNDVPAEFFQPSKLYPSFANPFAAIA